MTQAIAQDPVFMDMAREMQESMLAGGMGGLNLGEEGEREGGQEAPAPGGGMPPGMPQIDPNKYMEAMQRVMANPDFLQAAETLGRQLMTQAADPEMRVMMELFSNPANQELLKAKLEELKEDPELRPVMEDIEKNGQGAMARYMNDTEVMSKLGRKFQEALKDPELQARLQLPEGTDLAGLGADGDANGEAGEEGGEEEEGEATVHGLASAGDVAGLRELLAQEGSDANAKDEEGRTALHFAAGYNELDCMKALLEAGADPNSKDDNENTALHYAAGYGNVPAATLLLDKGADAGIKNAEGKTAAEVAEMNEQEELVALLREKAESTA
ncbi:hypothetical protein N2152v2_003801 [Parachlorella kessleri]